MAKCKICGKDIEDGKDFCEDCQKDMEQMDVDGELEGGLDDLDLDLNLDDFDLPELSGDLKEADLEFTLDDPDNDLENPQIVVRDREPETNDDIVDAQTEPESMAQPEELFSEISDVAQDEMAIPEISEDIAMDPIVASEGVEAVPEVSGTIQEDTGITDDMLTGLFDEAAATEDVSDLSGILPEDLMAEVQQMPDEEVQTPVMEEPSSEMNAVSEEPDIGLDLDGILSEGLDMGLHLDDAHQEDNSDIHLSMMDELPDAEEIAQMVEKKQKVSIWKRLFGNVKDEKWEKQKAKAEKKEADKLAKAEAEKAKKAEQAANPEEGEGEGEEGAKELDPKEAKKAAKLAKKEEKARRKAEKKEQKKQRKELADAEEEDEGRINRVGAAIVFVFFGLVAAFVVAGTNIFDYRTSVDRATEYFKEDEYSAAYEQLNGLEIKEKDKELYEKVQMVMYVDKELNSYRNYTSIRMYPEALHSLLRGLEKYDVHLNDAMELDVTEDYDKVRNKILSELSNEYDMTEKEAYRLIKEEDQTDYSQKVIKIANQSLE